MSVLRIRASVAGLLTALTLCAAQVVPAQIPGFPSFGTQKAASVTSVDLRSSTVRSGDGRETLVPNSVLLEHKVSNWTLETDWTIKTSYRKLFTTATNPIVPFDSEIIDANMPVVFLCTKDGGREKVMSNMQEVKARHGKIVAIATEGDAEVHALADFVIPVPQTIDAFTPLLSVIPLQLLAYSMATLRGCDVDMPRNLAKSVTVE